ncbi:hypothetical protein [Saccharothrix sp. HUAS TT1]|uniref:hypothetical protein n=1 Tax=unclassified Saccharothrix TaxID=2593673 RepID=UPI00345C197A
MTSAATDSPVPEVAAQVHRQRVAVRRVLDGVDDRLLVLAGPRCVRDTTAALDYAGQLAEAVTPYRHQLLVVLCAYPEAQGGEGGRRFLLDALRTGLPQAVRFTHPATVLHTADLVAYGLTTTRSTTDPLQWRWASRAPVPVGCENEATGDIGTAVAAVLDANAHRLRFSRAPAAHPAAHLVLRGGLHRPAHDPSSTAAALTRLRAAGLPPRLVVAVPGGGDLRRQRDAVASVARQRADGQKGLVGVAFGSFLHEGRQHAPLAYGVSTAEPCLSLPDTVSLLDTLAIAVERCRLRGR